MAAVTACENVLHAISIFPTMHLFVPPNFDQPLFFISPGYYSRPKRSLKQCLCKIGRGRGGGGRGLIRCIMGNVDVAYRTTLERKVFRGIITWPKMRKQRTQAKKIDLPKKQQSWRILIVEVKCCCRCKLTVINIFFLKCAGFRE